MMGKRLARAMAWTMLSLGIVDAAAQERPEIYLRAEDQERARSLDKPCQETDVGHGCWRFNDHLAREAPCTHIDAGIIVGIPVDQCFKMEEPRRYRGIWIDEFEGQAFIPEGTDPPRWPSPGSTSPGWRERLERARAASIWLDVERVGLEHKGGRKMRIDFVGRKTLYPGYYGHLGMSGSEIIVDRVISLKEIE